MTVEIFFSRIRLVFKLFTGTYQGNSIYEYELGGSMHTNFYWNSASMRP